MLHLELFISIFKNILKRNKIIKQIYDNSIRIIKEL